MKKLYDDKPIYMVEEYLNYGFEHIKDMTTTEIKNEITRARKDIRELMEEVEDCKKDGTPYYAMTEDISSLKLYIERLENELSDRESNKEKSSKHKK